MSETPATSSVQRFCSIWADSFSQLLVSLGVVSPIAQSSAPVSAQAPAPEEFESLVCTRFTGGGAVKGELLWVAEKAVALRLSQLFKTETPDPAVEFADAKQESYEEFLRQIAARTAASSKEESGSEIEIVFQPTVEPAHVTAQSTTLRLAGDKFPGLTLRLFLDEDLCSALSALPFAALPEEQNSQPTTTTPTPPPPVSPPPARTTPLPLNLALVLDVELEATIRFGERQMLLRDIFGLMAGTVVELNQMVNEPAELLVAGRLVARGEVVVVDGNFGLRVTEVASVNDRVAAIPLR